jgi:hypothetical protein
MRTILTARVDAQERVPAHRLDMAIQPAGIQSAIRQHDDGPIGRNHILQRGEERQPVRFPRTFAGGNHHDPGHWNGTAAVEDTDGEDGKALPQRAGIHGEREPPFGGRPPMQHPAQERCETGRHIQCLAFAAAFVHCLIAPLA